MSNRGERVAMGYLEVIRGTRTARSADFLINVPYRNEKGVLVIYFHRNTHIPYWLDFSLGAKFNN